jgi:hypothetical protein
MNVIHQSNARSSALTAKGTFARGKRLRAARTGAEPLIGMLTERVTEPGTMTPMGKSPVSQISERKL